MKQETLEEKIARVTREQVDLADYDPHWPDVFTAEKHHLLECLPNEMLGRIEHFGSTAVPGIIAKPIVDILVEVRDLEETRQRIAPTLEAQGYDYFWRPTAGDDIPPFYAWFIKRRSDGRRSHHIHMVEADFQHWDRLYFRDYLREHRDIADEYAALKQQLARQHHGDRVAYTDAKGEFIRRVTEQAKRYYGA